MLVYNSETKRIDNARKKLYRNFAEERKEIEISDLSDIEKQKELSLLLESTEQKIKILDGIRNGETISDEDREILGIEDNSNEIVADENVVNTLVSLYAKRAKIPVEKIRGLGIAESMDFNDDELEQIDTSAFEDELREYFTEHYYDLLGDGFNDFLSDVTEVADADYLSHQKNGELIQIAIKHNLNPKKFSFYGHNLTVQNGLVAEEERLFKKANIFYATPEGLNQKIFDLYSEILYKGQENSERDLDDYRIIKNEYVTYAEKNGIEIQDKDVLEELPIDMNKVHRIASYINTVLNQEGKISSDMTEKFAENIQKDYSKIMNLKSYNFNNLESVEEIVNDSTLLELSLMINEDSILSVKGYTPEIVYGTPEYVRDEYKTVMERIKKSADKDALISGSYDIERDNKMKEALRKYIRDNGIEGIDISIPKVEIDHKKTELITDAILNKYYTESANKEEIRTGVLKRVEDVYPEMLYERQVIQLEDLVGEELKGIGKNLIGRNLYVKDDFAYIGSSSDGQCVYATPEVLQKKIDALDEKIATFDINYEEKRLRETLVQYAKDNQFELQIPDIESIENRRKNQEDIFGLVDIELWFLEKDALPDDPTARKKLGFNDSVLETINTMSEGIPGAIAGITELIKSDEAGIMLLLGLDDMNIRGSQIWEAYKYLYNEDGKKFAKAIKKRDKKMVDFINEELASVGGEKAVLSGASFDRNKRPDMYRFTKEDVEKLKEQREQRIIKEKEQREKMLANSPKKKNRRKKKIEERKAKKQAYRQRLIDMGKKSLEELDTELTELKEKEQQAKNLCEQYEKQLSSKSNKEYGEEK